MYESVPSVLLAIAFLSELGGVAAWELANSKQRFFTRVCNSSTLSALSRVEILTDAELSSTTIYYFPSDTMTGEDVVDLDESQIVPCQERRILESVEEFTEVDVPVETLIEDN